jgi:NHLM bacteriocin system secretion protein
MLTREGDCVQAGQPMARVEQVQLRLALEEGRRRVEQLRSQDQLARLQASRERSLVADELARLLPYRPTGAIAEETFIDKEKQLQRIDSQQLAEAQQRSQAINNELLTLVSKEQELGRNKFVVAPLSGCVVESLLTAGSVVNPGTVLFTMERNDRRGELVSFAYFPSQDGKRLKPGQRVRITPTTTNAQRHGGIQGEILSIRALPVTREGLRQRFGVESLVDAVFPTAAQSSEPLIEVVTSLQRDPNSRSGYDWGGGSGPDLKLTPGTTTAVSVLVEGRQPISYVIPLLRDLSGIY